MSVARQTKNNSMQNSKQQTNNDLKYNCSHKQILYARGQSRMRAGLSQAGENSANTDATIEERQGRTTEAES